MPCAELPSATAFTSSGCNLQNSAIWSKDRAVFSTSQTAGPPSASTALPAWQNLLLSFARPSLGAKLAVIADDGNSALIGALTGYWGNGLL